MRILFATTAGAGHVTPMVPLAAGCRAAGHDVAVAAPVLSLVPSALDGPRAGGVPVVRLRYETAPPTEGASLPRWGDPEAPLVYVSYGTVTAGLAPFAAVYPATVTALADRPVRALVTVGDSGDPATLGPLPDNVLVERFRPQQDVMPLAAAVIGHGGFGTTMTALAHGVPLVVLPLFALDQRINALAVADAGAGVALDGGPADVGRLGEALDAVLGDGSFGTGARRVADEISALPPAATTAAVLERLVG